MDDIAEQLAKRDRFVRRHWALQTWSQRLADMDRHQEETWNAMVRSPAAFQHFLRRNLKARAIQVVTPDVE